MIVLGVPAGDDLRVSSFNFEKLGFQGPDMDHIDPKFLLELDGDEVKKVRSFELEDYDKIFSSEGKNLLPPTLIKVDTAKSSEVKHFIGNVAASFGKSLGFPLGTTTVLSKIHSKTKRNIYKLQAFYLLEILNKSLPDYNLFPELRAALSPRPEVAEQMIKKLGSALLVLYNTQSNLAGVSSQIDDSGDSFEKWRAIQAGIRSQNQGYLLRLANEMGLHVVPIGQDFSVLFVSSTHNPETIAGLQKKYPAFLNVQKMSEHLSKHQEDAASNSGSGQLLPVSIVSYIHPKGPIEIVNFPDPGTIGQKIQDIARMEIAKELSGSFVPFSNLVINSVMHKIKKSSLNNGDTRYLDHLQSFGALLALTETHAYRIHRTYRPLEICTSRLREAVDQVRMLHPLNFKHFSTAMNDIAYLLGSEEEKKGRLTGGPTLKEIRSIKKAHYTNLERFFGVEVVAQNNSQASRSPSSLPSFLRREELPERKPVILFLIDGLRPDRFKIAAEEGLLPNLKSLFVDHGTHLESYASRSLTVPSWSTILTGFENDMNGIRSNTPTSRFEQKTTDNFLDPMSDLLLLKYISKSRSFHRLEENQTGEPGKVWLPAYFHEDQRFYNFIPVVKKPHYAFKKIFSDIPSQLSDLFNRTWNPPTALDVSSAWVTAKAIREDKENKLRFVMNWYASVDEAQHYNNHLLPSVYKELDQSIGGILEAARKHPVLKDATVFLLSDHGHSGGYGPFDENSTVYRSKHPARGTLAGPLMIHTGFNLTNFFQGRFQNHKNYTFKVTASTQPHQPYYFDSFKGLGIAKAKPQPFFRHKNSEVLIDYAGDNLAHVYLKGLTQWDRRHNFYELTHFVRSPGESPLNIPADLLNIQLENVSVTHHKLSKKIIRKTEKRPVGLLAMALPGQSAKDSADRIFSVPGTAPSSRDPVLVMARGKAGKPYRYGLILTRSLPGSMDQFRYLVLKDFQQTPDGRIVGQNSELPTLSNDPNDDPLDYLGNLASAVSLDTWKGDREWLELAQNHPKPTAVFALARALTLSSKFMDPASNQVNSEVKKSRQGEVPDFLVISNPGYAFHSDIPEESDHGGLSREEVRNTFFVGSLNPNRYLVHREIRNPPILTRDFMATILNYAGMGEPGKSPLPQTQGVSFKSVIEFDNSSQDRPVVLKDLLLLSH
jgi:hypothetical protein